MIFNDKYNGAIELMKETSEEFTEVYDSIVGEIPSPIRKKCQKCRGFEKEYDDIGYTLETGMDDDGAIEFCIDAWDKGYSAEIYVAEVVEKKLKKMEIVDENLKYGYLSWEFGGLEITKGENVMDFAFELKRVDENKYQVIMQKSINNEIKDEPSIKNFTLNELLEKLNIKKSRR